MKGRKDVHNKLEPDEPDSLSDSDELSSSTWSCELLPVIGWLEEPSPRANCSSRNFLISLVECPNAFKSFMKSIRACQLPWCQGLVPSSYTRCKDKQSYVDNIFKVQDEFWGCFWFGLEGCGGLINKRKIALKWATQKISSWNEFKRGLLTGVLRCPLIYQYQEWA